jgi:predicted O-linked N-acetylglucosamine transferase (SPINDLY family)
MLFRQLFAGMRSGRSEFKRGTAALLAGRMDEALVALRRAVELKPDLPEAHYNLGAVYRTLGNRDEALAAYRRAAELAPGFAAAHVDVGSVLRERRDYEDAERSLRTALALQPDHPEALLELGNVLKVLGDWRTATDTLRRAASVDPGHVRARWAAVMAEIPALDDADTDREARRRAFAVALDEFETWCKSSAHPEAYTAVGGAQPFYLAYHEVSNRDLLARYGSLCVRLMQGWQQAAGLAPPQRVAPGKRIRVGIVSAHFSEHSVWQALVRGWVKKLDRERFELHLFHLTAMRDEETRLAVSLAAAFHEGKGSFEKWARLIHESRLDVLIYPEIGMDPTTVKLACLRLAPVQATSWGHPQTSGLPTIDYYLSGTALEPQGAEAEYTETLELLPGTGSWLELEADAPAVEVELPAAEVRLLCPGMPFKYAAEHDALLIAIARRVPGAKLIFFRAKPEVLSQRLERRLRAAFARAGLDFDRHAVFLPWQTAPAFRAVLAAADLYLDTLGFSGYNTALQAIRCGLPVVTRDGRFMRGRLAAAILRQIDLDELIAPTDAAYVELVVALAGDARRREALRERIRAASGRLFEDEAPIRALERFLERVTHAP